MTADLYFIIPSNLKEEIIASQIIPLSLHSNYETDKKHVLAPNHSQIYTKNTSYYNILFFTLILKKLHGIFYCRSIFDFLAVFSYKKMIRSRDIRIIYDFRGLISEESFIRNKSNFRKYFLQSIERFVYKNADEVHCVSKKFKNFLIERYGFREIVVIPCCSPKYSGRKVEKPIHEVKFVYVGSMAKWQNFSGVVDYYKKVENRYVTTSLRVITRERDEAQTILKSRAVKNYELLTLPHDQVIENISDCHFGFILREISMINLVSSPIKFLEYLQAGVAPVISSGIGDYSELVAKERIGIVVPDFANPDLKIEKFNFSQRSSRIEEIALEYTWPEFFKKNMFTML